MGFYECIHDCGIDEEGNNCYCVSIGSSLDNFQSTSWSILCKKHKDIRVGSKFQYSFRSFVDKFKKKGVDDCFDFTEDNPIIETTKITEENFEEICKEMEYSRFLKSVVRDVEIIDMKDVKIRKGTVTVVRFRTDLDCSNLDESKKINFSMFDVDVTSWCKDDNYYIITLQFFEDSIYRPEYRGYDLYYRWNRNEIGRVEDYKLHEEEDLKRELEFDEKYRFEFDKMTDKALEQSTLCNEID